MTGADLLNAELMKTIHSDRGLVYTVGRKLPLNKKIAPKQKDANYVDSQN
jgi:hypothetical protein